MSWRDASGIELVQPLGGRHALLDDAGVVLREVADRDLVAPPDRAAVDVARATPAGLGASASSALSSVVLPAPFRPTSDDLLAAVDDAR